MLGIEPQLDHGRPGARDRSELARELGFAKSNFYRLLAASMEKFTPTTIGSRKDLVAELAQIRGDGFAINRGERVTGVCGVAAPVVNSAGDVSAATGIPCPAERLNYRALHNYRPLVRDVAARLPHDLGAVTAYAERSPRASAPRSARSHPLRD